jgi:hypothetical protein
MGDFERKSTNQPVPFGVGQGEYSHRAFNGYYVVSNKALIESIPANAQPGSGSKVLIDAEYIDGVKNETILYDNTECVSDEKLYRIITSEDCKLISLWIKNTEDEIFKKIKTFSYPGGIEKAGIKLSVDDSMELNQLSFSFLQANV